MKIMKCSKCGAYTLKAEHCGEPTVTAHPPKFSMEKEKRYGKYRREAKVNKA
ncbi:MAG: nucleolar RNA-binding Nop10p family protein [Candidatus Aenigmatarchaeota archaeon]